MKKIMSLILLTLIAGCKPELSENFNFPGAVVYSDTVSLNSASTLWFDKDGTSYSTYALAESGNPRHSPVGGCVTHIKYSFNPAPGNNHFVNLYVDGAEVKSNISVSTGQTVVDSRTDFSIQKGDPIIPYFNGNAMTYNGSITYTVTIDPC